MGQQHAIRRNWLPSAAHTYACAKHTKACCKRAYLELAVLLQLLQHAQHDLLVDLEAAYTSESQDAAHGTTAMILSKNIGTASHYTVREGHPPNYLRQQGCAAAAVQGWPQGRAAACASAGRAGRHSEAAPTSPAASHPDAPAAGRATSECCAALPALVLMLQIQARLLPCPLLEAMCNMGRSDQDHQEMHTPLTCWPSAAHAVVHPLVATPTSAEARRSAATAVVTTPPLLPAAV